MDLLDWPPVHLHHMHGPCMQRSKGPGVRQALTDVRACGGPATPGPGMQGRLGRGQSAGCSAEQLQDSPSRPNTGPQRRESVRLLTQCHAAMQG